ncbi:MAG: acetyl-CoA carboxylase, carboxyltransferase subunit beta [Planctomycetes bacterium]|nr:acetyl-CoA carboxylase, carboxyltransferase subunit beta [Planctomycetota bacterium]
MRLFRRKKKEMRSGLWTRCTYCEAMVYTAKVDENYKVCPECDFHFTISAKERIAQLCDEGTFEELDFNLATNDPLKFEARAPYMDKIRENQERTGMLDACVYGPCEIRRVPVVLCIVDATFFMGSMGSVVGEKICRAAELARKERKALIVISGSGGGARMQEGIVSLMQMAKTSSAIARLREAHVPFISVLTNPTMGGSMASFAALGDVIIAEPKALLGFTGPKVIEQTIKKTLPEGFQRSEFMLSHGLVDMIVSRKEMRETLALLCTYLNGEKQFPESGGEAKNRITTRVYKVEDQLSAQGTK